MFEKILIANRGEIACRVIRTCRRLGIAHGRGPFRGRCRRAARPHGRRGGARSGRPPAAESYLRIERIVEAARRTGAQAVHPGYGFLAENAAFAEALAAEGIVFIGPPAAAIRAMGDKLEAKRLAAAAGVSIVPGHPEAIGDRDLAARIAAEHRLPGDGQGGGRRRRQGHADRARRAATCARASSARRARRAPRSATTGCSSRSSCASRATSRSRCWPTATATPCYLGERECSIQRRHQKVIEEAPSPFLDEATRRAMGEQAVALARAVDYRSAGTVEFIVDAERNFYFLEMNTRLQVEHPVTELVTGLDLVEQMLRIAAGEPLALTQDDVRLDGWAIEARVYAEDPGRGFLPSTGRLRALSGAQGRGDPGRFRRGRGQRGVAVLRPDDRQGLRPRARSRRRDRAPERGARRLLHPRPQPQRRLPDRARSTTAASGRASSRPTSSPPSSAIASRACLPTAATRTGLAAVAVALRLVQAQREAQISGQLPGWRPTPARGLGGPARRRGRRGRRRGWSRRCS